MSHSLRLRWAIGILLFVVTAAVFLPSLECGFVNWDDPQNFLDNPNYRGLGWTQIKWMWTSHLMSRYIPLTWMTLGLDYTLWGMSPFGYHLTNVLLHALNVALFFFVVLWLLRLAEGRDLSGDDDWGERLGAMLAALLFGLHPLRVESVTWITERRDSLSGLFCLLAVLAYLRYTRQPRRKRDYWICLGCFVAGVLSKEITIMLVGVFVVMDVYPLRRWRSGIGVWIEKVPFVLIGAASTIAAFRIAAQEGTLTVLETLSPLGRLQVAVYGLVLYLRKTVLPLHLSPFYAFVPAKYTGTNFLLGVGILGCILALGILAWRRYPALLSAFAVYAIFLAPVVGIAQNGPQLAADRYSYLSCLGWAVLAGSFLMIGWNRSQGSVALRASMVAVSGLAVVILSVFTLRQIPVWADSDTLWRHALATDPSPQAFEHLGLALEDSGNVAGAIVVFRQGLEFDTTYDKLHNNLGAALLAVGDVDNALDQFREANRLNPRLAQSRYGLGVGLVRAGRIAEAIPQFEEALRIKPDYPAARRDLEKARLSLSPR